MKMFIFHYRRHDVSKPDADLVLMAADLDKAMARWGMKKPDDCAELSFVTGPPPVNRRLSATVYDDLEQP